MDLLKKKRIKRESKEFIKNNIRSMLNSKVFDIKEKLFEGFDSLFVYLQNTDSKIDLMYFRDLLENRLEDFEFILDTEDTVRLSVPSMDNLDFTDLEFIEIISNGMIGIYAEATLYEVLTLFGNSHGLMPINEWEVPEKHIYLVQVTDYLLLKEKESLNYTLPRTPFSNMEPLVDEIFGPMSEYVEDHLDDWISESIKDSMAKIKNVYGGK